ncbi:MAG: ACP S-malonyltransferase, partial [Bdellovibrionota bacterium]
VLWKQSVAALIEGGYSQGVEFGPGKVLTGLAKRIAAPLAKPFVVSGISDSTTLKAYEAALKGASA